ncbi:RHS repeat-associated protein [Algoriphagus sp. 4150]|uniref:RHS repeat-associated core domain-containing protein n=1 Tax=Algoriphagus sp. 4150 TaxID=2817756 RepID=UPI00285C78CC|nr:RHS repeat-associated core domain-containing protein [Algoriphagus sp. 4150]MDR7130079.1 RHS repeat-associated protein [Algoriphagus sp. 4150]
MTAKYTVEKKQDRSSLQARITRYVRDTSGNVMAVYQADTISERPIYGSSRLGNLAYASTAGYRTVGYKQYELSNHLGNVLAVVSDRIHMKTDSTWSEVISRSDYYPFGLAMDGRTESSGYRYGFNGKEKDTPGMGGGGSTYDYGFRIYNPKIAKFLSVDPLSPDYPWYTPYQFAGNTPIAAIDLDGLEPEIVVNEIGKQTGTQILKQTGAEVSKKLAVNSSGKLVEIGVRGGMGAARLLSSSIGAFLNVLIPADPGESAQFASLLNYEKHRFKELSNKPYTNLSEFEKRELNSYYGKYELDANGEFSLKGPLSNEVSIFGIYDDSTYLKHGSEKVGSSSSRPVDGQKALDNSFLLNKKREGFSRRIAVEEDHFVILDEHSPGQFHGHQRNWDELLQPEKNALIREGVVNNRGKIQK